MSKGNFLVNLKNNVKTHSPELLIIGGTIGIVTTVVTACRATLKVNETLEESKENIQKIHEAKETGVTEAGEVYDMSDYRRDLSLTYFQTGIKFAKLYAPSVFLGVFSVGAIIGSHVILRNRNLALAATCAAIDKSFTNYRGRVVERFGEEIDTQLRTGVASKEIEETVINEKTGKEKKVKKTVNVVDDPTKLNPWSKFFDQTCMGWTKDPEANRMILEKIQCWANEKLKRYRGAVLSLNEVYDALGIERTKLGQIMGWVNDSDDAHVDFGIINVYADDAKRRFNNGLENVVLLDFPNVRPILNDMRAA